jgi:SRSO17 transposase
MTIPREPRPTIGFIDEYCQLFQDLFAEVRSYEAFKLLHLGMVSEIKRKSLPAIAQAVGLTNPQGLQHFNQRIAMAGIETVSETIRSDSEGARRSPFDSVD